MSEQLTAPVRRFYEAFTVQHDIPAATVNLSESAVITWQSQTMDVPSYQGIGRMFLDAFPDLHFQIDEQFVAGDRVVTRGTWSGTNSGSLMGAPSTGKSFRSAGIVIDRVVEGRIVERWEVGDVFGMMQQIGLAPSQ
jgi:predicted ester cyclase